MGSVNDNAFIGNEQRVATLYMRTCVYSCLDFSLQ